MARLDRARQVGHPLLAIALLASCDGKLIHLGDGRVIPDGGPVETWSDLVGGDAATDDAATPCAHAAVAANEVLWIGDGWITIPGVQVPGVEAAAQTIGAIGPNDHYAVAAAAGVPISTIVNQYNAKTAPKPKVLIMDGGTIDTFATNGADATVNAVAATFTQLLDQIAKDGTVRQIIYFLQPELPKIPGVAALRPFLKQACAQSMAPCYFVDLQDRQPRWLDHPEYTTMDGILPTAVGGKVIADAIWEQMQQACIAQ